MEKTIKLEKTFRYFTYGNIDTAENIWFVLHGYGQLPYYFIRKFQTLDPGKNFVVAPEGMHRFYLEGTSGRVGASWMTKEARLDDINDNHNYLNQLATKICNRKTFKKRFLLGFSQGGATASRWHDSGSFNADHFILWASVFPPDLEFNSKKSRLANSDNTFVVGKQDPFFKEKTDEVQDLFNKQDFSFKIVKYDGGHDIDGEVLKKISQNLDS
ncbi:MAG: hypothetical protein WEA99_07785 [Brumimicrobium sp.]